VLRGGVLAGPDVQVVGLGGDVERGLGVDGRGLVEGVGGEAGRRDKVGPRGGQHHPPTLAHGALGVVADEVEDALLPARAQAGQTPTHLTQQRATAQVRGWEQTSKGKPRPRTSLEKSRVAHVASSQWRAVGFTHAHHGGGRVPLEVLLLQGDQGAEEVLVVLSGSSGMSVPPRLKVGKESHLACSAARSARLS
jgi:hypothetical protein